MDFFPDLRDHLGRGALSQQRRAFADDGFVVFPGLFAGPALVSLQAALEPALRRARRRELLMPDSDYTPRRMLTVGGDVLAAAAPRVPLLYHDPALRAALAEIAEGPLLPVPDPIENHVLNILDQIGDIHGAHVDTYAYAFNLLIEAPPPGAGGLLEFVPGSTQPADLVGPRVRRVPLAAGDAYLLRTDRNVHRVSPLERAGRRVLLNFAYADETTVGLRSYSSSLLYG